MNSDVFRFNVGKFNCVAVSDGTMTYAPPAFPPAAVFLCMNAPREQLNEALSQRGTNAQQWVEWTSPYTCLLIDTGVKKLLVDTGAGSLSPTTGKLLQNLKSIGISPENVDVVIITHAHPDHIGGSTDNEGNQVFPEARWVIGKDEWRFWTSKHAEQQLPEHGRDIIISIARKNLFPLKERIELVEENSEIVPGIRVIPAPGHTPGQIALNIYSEGAQLMYISDVAIHPLHLIEPQWCAAVDIVPDIVAETRHKIFNKIEAEKTLVMAFHFPFPGLGYVVRKGRNWEWQPLQINDNS